MAGNGSSDKDKASKYGKKVQSRVKRKVKKKIKKSPIIIAIILLLAVAGLLFYQFGEEWFGISLFDSGKKNGESIPTPSDGEVLIHFIDVGQGDAILITTKSGNMLIDTGDKSNEAKEKLTGYLDAAGVKNLKYVVLTHTDADHIGNAAHVILNYNVENVLMPNYTKTTSVYEGVIDAIENTQTSLILVGDDDYCQHSGYSFVLGSVRNTVIAPVKDYKDANEMSIVIKSEYGETSVMLTGDAEGESEADILKSWNSDFLKCDILKIGHHGSRTSTSEDFLKAVSPTFAVISCGEGNSYGHPHMETLEKLKAAGAEVYRTDTDGSIVFKTDGNIIERIIE